MKPKTTYSTSRDLYGKYVVRVRGPKGWRSRRFDTEKEAVEFVNSRSRPPGPEAKS